MYRVSHALGLSLAVLTLASVTALAADKVEVKVVKYKGLTDTIKNFKGHLVVVDFWADT